MSTKNLRLIAVVSYLLCASLAFAQRISPQGGTITKITPHSPLAGGGTAGAIDLYFPACASPGDVYVSNGTAMVCGTPSGGADKLGPDGNVGDATVGGTGTTLTINNAAVTLAKMANLATARFVCRVTAGTGVPESCTSAQATSLLDLATTLVKGLMPTLDNNPAHFLDGTGNWSTPGGGGDITDVNVSATSPITSSSSTCSSGACSTTISTSMSTARLLGRVSASTGVVEQLTSAQATANFCDTFSTSSSTKGCVPGSNGGGTGVYLNGAGGYTTPAGTTYSAGASMSLIGNAFALNIASPASCSAGSFVSAYTATGAGTCTAETGDIAGVTTAGPLSGGCTSGTCALTTSVASGVIMGRVSASTGVMEQLTSAQATTLINPVTTSTAGLVSALPSDATKYFDGTGNWSTPAGGYVPEATTTTGTINSYALGSTTTALFFTGSGTTNLNGLQGGVDGRCVDLRNVLSTNSNVTLVNEQAGSTAVDRINTAGSVNFPMTRYSGSRICWPQGQSRWIPDRDYVWPTITVSGAATISGNTILNNGAAHASVFSNTNVTIDPGSNAGVLSLGTNSSATGGVVIGSASGPNPVTLNGPITVPGRLSVSGDTVLSGRLRDTGTTPTLSSCGAGGGTVTGGMWSFDIAIITSGTTACTATFSQACGATPTCGATPKYNPGGGAGQPYISAVSTSAVTIATTGTGWTSSTPFSVICVCH